MSFFRSLCPVRTPKACLKILLASTFYICFNQTKGLYKFWTYLGTCILLLFGFATRWLYPGKVCLLPSQTLTTLYDPWTADSTRNVDFDFAQKVATLNLRPVTMLYFRYNVLQMNWFQHEFLLIEEKTSLFLNVLRLSDSWQTYYSHQRICCSGKCCHFSHLWETAFRRLATRD